MNKGIGCVLFAGFLFTCQAFAQNASDGVLVSPPVQQQDNNGGQTSSNNSPNHENNGPGNNTPQTPPQAAIDACQDKSEGDSCQITTRHGPKEATCSYTPDKQYLICNPKKSENRRQNGQQGRPQP